MDIISITNMPFLPNILASNIYTKKVGKSLQGLQHLKKTLTYHAMC